MQHRAAESFLSLNDYEIANVVARREVVHSSNQASPPKPARESGTDCSCNGCWEICGCRCCNCSDSDPSWNLLTWSVKGEYVSDGSNLIDRTVQDNVPMITVILGAQGDPAPRFVDVDELAKTALEKALRDKLQAESNGQFDNFKKHVHVFVTLSAQRSEVEAKVFFMPGSGVDSNKALTIVFAISSVASHPDNYVTPNNGVSYHVTSASAAQSTPPPWVMPVSSL